MLRFHWICSVNITKGYVWFIDAIGFVKEPTVRGLSCSLHWKRSKLLKHIFASLQKARLEGVAWRLLLLLLWWPSRWMDNQTRCPWIKRSGTGRRQVWRCANKSVWEVKGKVIRVYFSPKRRQELHPWTLIPFAVSLLETGLYQAQQTVVPIALKSLTIKQIEAGCFVRLAEGKRAH